MILQVLEKRRRDAVELHTLMHAALLPAAVILHDEVQTHLKELVGKARVKTQESLGQADASAKAASPSKVPVYA